MLPADTEIDWIAYMDQVKGYLKVGEHDRTSPRRHVRPTAIQPTIQAAAVLQ